MHEEDISYIQCNENCPFIPILTLDINNHKLYSKCSKFFEHSNIFELCKYDNTASNYVLMSEEGNTFSFKQRKNKFRCSKCQVKRDNLIYCDDCKKIFCLSCHNSQIINIDLNSNQTIKKHYYLPINLINTHCIQHNKRFTSYCYKCKVNACECCIIHQYHSLFKASN